MKNNQFILKYEKEQSFSFLDKYKNGCFKDDSGYRVCFAGTVMLISSEFTEGDGTFYIKYPWAYTFEIVR